ncbi:MAG: hypothetical protein MZV65_05115 [Chromatiales bacterium]|nr:hypothetical protein [Chromatiales bacterium]
MLTLEIPEQLQRKIAVMASLAEQTPEQLVLEMLEEHLDHHSAYIESAYLQRSERNRARLDRAIQEIKNGVFEPRALIDD